MRSQITGYPPLELHEEKVLIVVKTYPRPSAKYRELVCTAGITVNGKWVRLYPISYRYLDYNKWYKKYQWINIKIEKNKSDFRIDSYRPIETSIQAIGEPLPTNKQWNDRKNLILPTVQSGSLEEIEEKYKKDSISLGIFKPKEIVDFVIEQESSEWSKRQQQELSQLRLFEAQPKSLGKIPFKFSYKFICNDKHCDKPHKLSIIDWEINALYLNMKEKYRYDMDVVLQKVKEKWLAEMWSDKRDSYLIVGTQFPNPTFMVLGVFWPPK